MTLHKREIPEAAAELDAAADWYADQWLPLAIAFVNAVAARVDHVLAWPSSGRAHPRREGRTPEVRTAPVTGFPYSIVDLVDGDELVILAYSHHKRRPGYWEHRVDG